MLAEPSIDILLDPMLESLRVREAIEPEEVLERQRGEEADDRAAVAVVHRRRGVVRAACARGAKRRDEGEGKRAG